MAGSKRKHMSLDDLMRQQEDTLSKKHRLDPSSVSLPDESDTVLDDDEPQSETASENDNEDVSSESESSGHEDATPAPEQSSGRLNLSKIISRNSASASQQKASENGKAPEAIKSFSSLGISTPLQLALSSMSIIAPTEVQVACIPPLLEGRDCVGNAKTGSGKTIAFALPILQKLSVDPYGIFALVLTPTRELAFQLSEQFAVLGLGFNIKTSVIVGGMDMMSQALELANRPHVVIATPGRIVDHLRSSNDEWNLSRVKFLVLDEADRLLTSTFANDLAYIFSAIPKDRQTCLFTATLTPSIESLIQASPRPGKQRPFVHRMTTSTQTVDTLEQKYMLVPSHVRELYLFYLLCHPPESTLSTRRAPPEQRKASRKAPKTTSRPKLAKTDVDDELEQPPPTIIFCRRARTAAYLTLLLKTLRIRSAALHSRLTQRERLNSLQLFRSSVVPVLISTDVGSRGLDIDDVALVVNWDMPDEPEEYTHRVGRTARAGRQGVAISFVTERDEERVLRIENQIHLRLEELVLPEAKVLEGLSQVSTAKRLANMELHDSHFGQREEIHRKKQRKEGTLTSV